MSQPHTKDTSDTPPAMPGWVKVFGATLVVLVVAVVVLHLTGTSFGPSMHGMPGPHGAPQP
ncbi:MAG: hypothetical protein RLZZ387_2994 [Chloroflexota bacterium]